MRYILPLIFAGSLPQFAASSEADALAARIMWSAFECATYAEMIGDIERQNALFERGLAAGRQFFSAVEAGAITEEQFRTNVPILVPMLAGGPSVDFALGRIFETALGSAYDQVVKKDLSGFPLKMEDWVFDDELKKSRAEVLYRRANCSVM